MHPPCQNRFVYVFFSWFINRIIRRDFQQFEYNAIEIDPKRSVLLLANHFSWWDGFFLFQLNRLFLKKRFHIMVSEENYRQVWFLKYLGAFSVKKQSRSMIETLEYAGELLNDPENLVVIFPQGKLYSSHTDEVRFEKGLMNLINSSAKNFQYLFAVLLTDYFEHRKPTVKAYLQTWEGAEFTSLQLIKSEFNKHFDTSRKQQSNISV
ncbi:MAG: lysophospholipid acyltransferase family protein [Sphingobacteriaceae bacterium]